MMVTNTPAVLAPPSALASSAPRPTLPPTSSATVTPITARVAPMRRPLNSAGSDQGNSIFQKICARVALNRRARSIIDGSTLRTEVSTLISTGKKTIRMAVRMRGVML